MLDVVSPHDRRGRRRRPRATADEEVDETVAFLEWLRDHHFVFLGVREYDVVETDARAGHRSRARLRARDPARRGALVVHASRRSTPSCRRSCCARVQSGRAPGHLEDAPPLDRAPARAHGRHRGQEGRARRRGSPARSACSACSPRWSTWSRRPARRSCGASCGGSSQAEDLIAGSHDYKAVVAIFESFPRDELFQATADELRRAGDGRARRRGVEERHPDACASTRPGATSSALIAMPRDRFNVERPRAAAGAAARALRRRRRSTTTCRSATWSWPSCSSRSTSASAGMPDVSYEPLEADIVAACRSWDDELEDLLVAPHGEARGRALARAVRPPLPRLLQERHAAADARCSDIDALEEVRAGRAVRDQAAERARRATCAEGAAPLTRARAGQARRQGRAVGSSCTCSRTSA